VAGFSGILGQAMITNIFLQNSNPDPPFQLHQPESFANWDSLLSTSIEKWAFRNHSEPGLLTPSNSQATGD
jgi:hypothetical protein